MKKVFVSAAGPVPNLVLTACGSKTEPAADAANDSQTTDNTPAGSPCR